jgi:hypothetical protein
MDDVLRNNPAVTPPLTLSKLNGSTGWSCLVLIVLSKKVKGGVFGKPSHLAAFKIWYKTNNIQL